MGCERELAHCREKAWRPASLTTQNRRRIFSPQLLASVRKMSDDRQYAPATPRNRDFILDVRRDVLPMTGVILEIASGSGEHIVHFAKNFSNFVFQPSDPEPDALLSIAAWMKATGVTNVRAPIALAGVTFGLADRIGQRV